ncbi:hypothetical protein D3C87_1470060 [compost metagenome]
MNRHQPLMQPGEHQRQESARQYCSNHQSAAINGHRRPVGNRLGDQAAQRLQRRNRDGAGNQRRQQRVEDQLNRAWQKIPQPFFDPAHQSDHQQYRDDTTAPRLERLAKQGDLRQLRAGEDPRHHATHRHRAAVNFRRVDTDEDVHDGKHCTAENAQNAEHVWIVGRKITDNIRAFKDVDNPGNQAGGDKRRDQRNKNVSQLSQRIAHRGFVFGFSLRFVAIDIT